MTKGILYGIGVGPGDPDLITVKAQKCLQSCPVIAYPAPVGKDSLALRIAHTHIPQNTALLRLEIPMVTDQNILYNAYNEAADRISEYLENGQDVGCICEGDPLFYGSFVYLMQRLRDQFSMKIIPGVSSIMAGAGIFQQPLCVHHQDVCILPGTLPKEVLHEKLRYAEVAVIMKIGRHFDKITEVLKSLDRYQNSYFVAYATMEQEYHCPLPEVKFMQIPYFSLIYARGTHAEN